MLRRFAPAGLVDAAHKNQVAGVGKALEAKQFFCGSRAVFGREVAANIRNSREGAIFRLTSK